MPRDCLGRTVRRWLLVGLLLGAAGVLLASPTVASPIAADGAPGTSSLNFAELRCEYRHNPLGIGAERPRLSWTLTSEERGARQTAFRVQVAESRAALREGGEHLLWDTGKVESDRSTHHAYAGGPALQSRERYHWRVKVWDEDGHATGWSAPRWWEMGLLAPSDWSAEWIEPAWEEEASTPPPSPVMRNAFEVDGDVASARLYVSAHGLYEAFLNGERVGRQLFTPGWTSYEERLQYQVFDVAHLLREGRNALGAMLGDGWYRGYMGFPDARNNYGKDLALLAQIEVTYENGATQVVAATGAGDWRATPDGPIRKSDIYMGETYDARREMRGWATPGFDASAWTGGVRSAEHSKAVLIAPADPPVRRIQTLTPERIFETPEGDLVADMGQNMVGWVRLRMGDGAQGGGARGDTVTLRHAEVLDKDGNVYTANLRSAEATDRYVMKGGGEEVYEPRFTFHGFRYVAIDGYPGELTKDDLEGVVIHSDMGPTGHFQSSSALLNQLQSNIVWGQKGNFLDVPTDTPARDERLGWTGDAQVFAQTAAFNMGVANFFTKWLRDLAADQYEGGSIPDVVPDVLSSSPHEFAASAGWSDAGVIVPWVLYRRYGDRRILRRQYDSMKDWVEYVRRAARRDSSGEEGHGRGGADTYLWDTGDDHYGDWLAYNSDESDYPGATTSKDLVATAYFARSADLFSRIAGVLDREADARRYERLFENVRAAFQEEFVMPRGRVASGTQTAYVLALSFDLLPKEKRDEAARRLASDVQERGHLTTGFLGTPDLLHVLSDYDYDEDAFNLLTRTDYPSWLYPVTRGATTMWERWDGIKPDSTFQDVGMNSFNHYAYGAIGDWLYREVAGIEPEAPGYRHFRIAPELGSGLTHARVRFESVRGPIASSWRVADGTFRLEAHVPANTRATVRLPFAAQAGRVTESGNALSDVEGVEGVRCNDSDVVLEVASGRYVFSYDAEALPDDITEAEPLGQAPPGDERTLATLLADAEARALLEERLPALYRSPWLSQAMNFPLVRADELIPALDLSAEELDAAARALKQRSR
jgi:alpha-L-rhamnosidase